MLRVKRAYEKPTRTDGVRVLVDRLWPRGVKKADAAIDEWIKDVTPSDALRRWYHENKEKRFKDFSKKYAVELKDQKEALAIIQNLTKKKTVTLVTAVKDVEHSHMPTLLKVLEK